MNKLQYRKPGELCIALGADGVLAQLVQTLHLDVGHEPGKDLEGSLHVLDHLLEILDKPKCCDRVVWYR